MFGEANDVPQDQVLRTGVCIIGAGAAGITLARRLEAARVDTILLEGGGMQLEAASQELCAGENTGLPYFPLQTSRLRYLGGTTNHWGGVCRPLAAEDFEPVPGIPLTGWPIGRAALDPYYSEAALICGLRNTDFDREEWIRDGRFPVLALDEARIRSRVVQRVSSSRRSFGARYQDELSAARHVETLLHANAVDIITDPAGKTVTAVEVATVEGNRFQVAADTVVLAAGGLENPRLLLASRHQHPRGLGNQHDVVGRYFLEHPRFRAGVLVPADPEVHVGFYEPHRVADTTLRGYLALPPARRLAEGLVDVQIRLGTRYDEPFEQALSSVAVNSLRALPDAVDDRDLGQLRRHLVRVLEDLSTWERFSVTGGPLPIPHPDVAAAVATATPVQRRQLLPGLLGQLPTFAYQKLTGLGPVDSIDLVARIDQAPNRDSRLTLGRERDALGLPRAQLHWSLSRTDRDAVLRTLELLGAETARSGVGRVRVLLDGDGQWPDDLEGGWHLMGTTRMSQDPRTGVVDRDGKVHGVSNLYIAGSSIFPTGGSGTPTLTIVALALRLAAHLEGRR